MELIDVDVSSYRPMVKGALQGFFTLTVMSLKISDCRYFMSGEKRWFTFPQKEVKKSGADKPEYFPLVSCLNYDFKKTLEEIVLDKLAKITQGVKKDEVQASKRASNSVQADASQLPF